MADCVYCGKPAGFLHKSHPECRNLHAAAEEKIPAMVEGLFQNPTGPAGIKSDASEIASSHFIGESELHQLLLVGFSHLVERTCEDHIISEDEDQRIDQLKDVLGISAEESTQIGALPKLAKAAILRDMEKGIVPKHSHIVGTMPLNLQKEETLIWLFNGVTSYAVKKHTEYVGRSSGVSIRIVRGVYYRTSSYRGHPVQTENLTAEASGALIITNKNVYFYSNKKSYKLGAKQIISANPYSDGIRISTGGASGRSFLFKLDDPCFAANVIAKLGQL